MLIRLPAEAAVKNWDVIERSIYPAIPPEHRNPEYLLRLQQLVANGRYVVWTIANEKREPVGVYVTTILYDTLAEERHLLGYALARVGDKSMQQEDIDRAFAQLKEYALGLGIRRIVAITQNPRAVDMCNSLGCRTDYTMVSFDIKE